MNIREIYNEVVTGCTYDFEQASEHNGAMYSAGITAAQLPKVEAAFVAEHHVGCCLHYGMTLFYKLRQHNVECYIAVTKEENPVTHKKTDNHVSVCYLKKDGQKYIADPVETVKAQKGDFYDIPIKQYLAQNGKIWIFDPYGEYGGELFFNGFLSHPLEVLDE